MQQDLQNVGLVILNIDEKGYSREAISDLEKRLFKVSRYQCQLLQVDWQGTAEKVGISTAHEAVFRGLNGVWLCSCSPQLSHARPTRTTLMLVCYRSCRKAFSKSTSTTQSEIDFPLPKLLHPSWTSGGRAVRLCSHRSQMATVSLLLIDIQSRVT